ncbi:autoinducer binding domain-containing protein [Actibacterium ureilyticum]|uniref:autoinducer binding domain-containing protein n=1 Tax=Actibacterium ureilyticum TaxID=1590614 RepID=UPI000BAA9787|nr:autoinducer binding domain-containing protein [Actibacterium ureilyticum]
MIEAVIPNFDSELETLQHLGPSGFVLVFNMTFTGPEDFYSSYPAEWQQIYQDEALTITDPIMHWVMTHSGFARWSDIRFPDPGQIMKRARQYDMNFGAVFSAELDGKRCLMTLARADREFTEEELELLHSKFQRYLTFMAAGCGSDQPLAEAPRPQKAVAGAPRMRNMFMFNEFQIQGYVGAIRVQDAFIEIDVAVTHARIDPETGQRLEEIAWNTVRAGADTYGYEWARDRLSSGDLVHIRGEIARPVATGQQAASALLANSVAYVPLRKADPGRPA